MFTCEYSYMSKYNGTFKDRDRNFETDARQMRNIDIDVIGKEYWLTSRTVFYGNTGTNFRLWYMGTNGNWFNQYIVVINKGEAERAYSRTYGLRIVLCLTPEVKVISGDGSEGNPYTLAP